MFQPYDRCPTCALPPDQQVSVRDRGGKVVRSGATPEGEPRYVCTRDACGVVTTVGHSGHEWDDERGPGVNGCTCEGCERRRTMPLVMH